MESVNIKPTYEQLEAEVLRLREELANLRRLIFGQKRERFVPAANAAPQLQMGLGGDPSVAPPKVETETITYTRQKAAAASKKLPSRNPIPAHLRREEVILEPAEDVTGWKKIGADVTEELEYQPGELYVKRYVRPKYARPDGEGVVVGVLPSRPIEKGLAGPGLIAHVLGSKFVDHLPLYRQRQQFRRQGVELSESTLCGWVESSCHLLLPLYEAQRHELLQTSYLMADETPIRVLDSSQPGQCHLGYHWVYHDPLRKLAFFDYQAGRGQDGPAEMLKNFTGHLQTDGYAAYEVITARPGVVAVGCWAHGRRYFDKAQDSDPERAMWMLSQIQQLYHLERHAREAQMSHAQRYQLRQESAPPIVASIKTWLDQQGLQVLPKSVIGKAVGYMLRQWPKLEKYLTDGRLEIDNNLIENAIRPVALGRKNYLFAGSHDGARRAALIYTLVATAKLHGVEPFAYLKDVLGRIADHAHKRVAELLPQNWKSLSPI